MPSRTYMVVHARRDHRIAVPRPDQAAALGTPDACSACHADRGAAWAAAAIRSHATGRRQGPSAAEALGPALTRVRGEEHDAAAALGALLADPAAAGIAKATALASVAPSEALALARPHLRAADPWLRLGAVQALTGAPLTARASAVAPLAADPARAVRLAAAPLLAGADRTAMGLDERRDVDALFAEHRAWLAANGDRAEAVVAQAGLHRAEGDGAAAQAAFERALRLDETSIVAYLNFADHLRGAGDDAAAEVLLRKACALYPESADAHHALGLALVRRKQARAGRPPAGPRRGAGAGEQPLRLRLRRGPLLHAPARPRAGHADGRSGAVPREPGDPGDAAGALRRSGRGRRLPLTATTWSRSAAH